MASRSCLVDTRIPKRKRTANLRKHVQYPPIQEDGWIDVVASEFFIGYLDSRNIHYKRLPQRPALSYSDPSLEDEMWAPPQSPTTSQTRAPSPESFPGNSAPALDISPAPAPAPIDETEDDEERDFKASNVSLDADCSPKVSDSGLRREATKGSNHISTRVIGVVEIVVREGIIRCD
ncbi:hypothetical protein IFM89_023291 [Coptis chinensis]|uniref:Uncharacterized protein n=1 Tax=Coptis chinensis TaxID=261450 RepID=A0A835H5W3_9MAGN|nr:hypothetical protein IFM89_023291 [Coptis chinensis]